MRTVDDYLAELGSALRVHGAVRRRFLRECRDHLVDAAAEHGEEEAVSAFGPAAEIAAMFDGEVADRRGVRSTLAALAGVAVTGASTLALIHASSANAVAPSGWAITFFIAAQLAGVTAGLALLQVLVMRRATMTPADIALLARRNAWALAASGLTIFSAGAALAGHGSPVLLLSGPALASVAMISVLRAHSLARRLDGSSTRAVRPPIEDLGRLVRFPLPSLDSRRLLLITTCVAAAAAFVRDRAEQATVSQAFATAGIEAAAVIGCFVLLGPALGLWRRDQPAGSASSA